jgi:hypothetical protein
MSGVTLAANRGVSLWTTAANAFGAWARATVAKQGDEAQLRILKGRMQSLAVSYIDNYTIANGKTWFSVESLPRSVKSVAQLVPRTIVTRSVGDKRTFGRLAKRVGVEGTVVPRTFESAAEAIEALASTTHTSQSPLVFLKTTAGSGSLGVTPVATKELATFLETRGGLRRGEILQEGVGGLALHLGRKFVIRSYFIVYDGALYVSKHAGAVVYGKQYDSAQTVREMHVELEDPNAIVDDLKAVVGEADRAKWVGAIVAAARLAGPMFESVVAETASDNLRYHVFGVDALPKAAGGVMLVESNVFPDVSKWESNVRMVESVLRLLYGVVKGGGEVDDELTKVWTMPHGLT